MKKKSIAAMRIAKTGYIIISLIFCILGVLFVVLPQTMLNILVKSGAILMILFGVIKLVGYFSKDLFRLAFQYDLEFGILLTVIGTVILLYGEGVLNFLCIAIGISILADSLFKIRISFQAKSFGIKSWFLILILALIGCIAGIILIIKPAQTISFVSVIIGISLICEGLLNLDVAITTVKIVKNQYSDRFSFYDISDNCSDE